MRPIWSDLRPSTHLVALESLEAPLRALLVGFAGATDPEWRSRAVDEIDRLIKAKLGEWAWGWCDYGGDDHMVIQAWCCLEHSLFPEGYAAERVAENAARIVAAVREWRTYLEHLEHLYAEVSLPGDPVAGRLAITGMIARIVTLVIEVTGCSDAWYSCAIDAVSWFLQHLGIPPAEADDIAAKSFKGRFESWIEPDATTRERAVGDAASAAFDAWQRIRRQEGA